MPSIEHNALVQLFRDNPALAPRLLTEVLGVEIPPHAHVAVVEATLDQLLPIEYRADLAVELRNLAGQIVLVAVIEVQLRADPDKKYSWPVYVTVSRARKRCPASVLVIAPDADVAAWAAEPIALGPMGGASSVQPLVLGPAQLPRITDIGVAVRMPELAVLSARAHGNGPDGLAVLAAAIGALERLHPEEAGVYFHIIYQALRDPVRRALEEIVMSRLSLADIPMAPFIQKLVEESRQEGVQQGKVEGLREALLEMARRAGVPLPAAALERIATCRDVTTLKHWVDNAWTARTADELLA